MKGKKILIFLIILMLVITGFSITLSGLKIKNEKFRSTKNSDLKRPWGYHKRGIDWNWAGVGLAEAEAKADEMEGELKSYSLICIFGKNIAKSWFYHGEENYFLPTGYEPGYYDIGFDFYYRGYAQGWEFAVGGDARATLKLSVEFGENSKTFTLYDRDQWPQTVDEDKLEEQRTFILENVYLEPKKHYAFHARLFAKTVADVQTFSADTMAKIKIYEAYLKEVIIPGGTSKIVVSPEYWDAGTVEYGGASSNQFLIENKGVEPAENVNIRLSGDSDFSFTGTSHIDKLKPGEKEHFTVKYTPTEIGQKFGLITVSSNNHEDIEVYIEGYCSKSKNYQFFKREEFNDFAFFTKFLNKFL